MSRIKVIFFAIILVTTGQTISVADDPATGIPEIPALLTLNDAVRIFRAHGLDLLLADAAVDSVHADELQAAAIANPALNGSLGHTFGYEPSQVPGCPGCSALAWSVGLSDQGALLDAAAGKRSVRQRVARAAMAAARASRQDVERTLVFQVKQDYVQALLAKDSLDLAREAQDLLTQVLALNQKRFNKGAIAETDLSKADTEKLRADQDVIAAEQALTTTKIAVAAWLGVRGSMPSFAVEPDLMPFVVPDPLKAATTRTLLERALRDRPDWRAASLQVDRAAAGVSLANRLLVPDAALSIQGSGEGTGTPALAPPTLSVGISIPLPLLYRFEGERAKAAADQRAQIVAREKVATQILADVTTAFAVFDQTRKRLELSESKLLPRARQTRDLVRLQYEKGAASLLEFLDAQRTFNSNNQDHLRALADYWTAVFALEQAIGGDLI